MSEYSRFTVSDLVAAHIISPPMDGNHGEIHPKADDYVPDGIPFVMASDLLSGSIDFQKCKFIEKKLADNLRKGFAYEDDVLLSHKATIGRTAIIQKNRYPYVMLTPQITAYRVLNKEKLLPKFLMYYFETSDFQKIFSAWAGGGSTRAYLGITAQLKLPIYVPSLCKQTAIASILGALDDKIDLNRRANETLEAMARALFRDWFVDFGPTRAKMAGQTPYLAPEIWELFPDRLDDEGKPEGWTDRPVKDFAELKGGKQLEKNRIASKGNIPVFGGAGIMGFTDEYNADGFVIAVGRVGAYCGQFFSHRGAAWINNNASSIRTRKEFSGEWLFYSLRNVNMNLIKKGAAQPFVSNSDISDIPIVWANSEIMSHFSEISTSIMIKKEHHEFEAQSLAQLRDLLLPKLMSGEIRIRDAEKMVADAL